jgi:hypothetical protein
VNQIILTSTKITRIIKNITNYIYIDNGTVQIELYHILNHFQNYLFIFFQIYANFHISQNQNVPEIKNSLFLSIDFKKLGNLNIYVNCISHQ